MGYILLSLVLYYFQLHVLLVGVQLLLDVLYLPLLLQFQDADTVFDLNGVFEPLFPLVLEFALRFPLTRL